MSNAETGPRVHAYAGEKIRKWDQAAGEKARAWQAGSYPQVSVPLPAIMDISQTLKLAAEAKTLESMWELVMQTAALLGQVVQAAAGIPEIEFPPTESDTKKPE